MALLHLLQKCQKLEAITATKSTCPDPASATALYVSTSLEIWETDQPELYCQDVSFGQKAYRKLDADYYAWIFHLVGKLKTAVSSGTMPRATLQRLEPNFSAIRQWAIQHIGEAALKSAVARFRPGVYQPPKAEDNFRPSTAAERPAVAKKSESGYMWPKDSDLPNSEPVDATAIQAVDAIKNQALSLGWTEARLFQNSGRYKFPFGEDYGLVCHLGHGKRIGEITAQHIEIIQPSGSSLKFYNPDVDQPFRRKII